MEAKNSMAIAVMVVVIVMVWDKEMMAIRNKQMVNKVMVINILV